VLTHEPRQLASWLIFDVSQMIRRAPLLLLIIAMLVAGCPRPTTLELQNGSGRDAIIVSGDRREEWKAAAVVVRAADSKLLEWRQDQDGPTSSPWLVILIGDKKLSFHLRYVLPREWSREFKRRLELRPDLQLYVIRPDGVSSDQPPGFPLRAKG
jgi:hypothetical protein